MSNLCYIPKSLTSVLEKSFIGRAPRHLGGSHTTVTYPPIDGLNVVQSPETLEKQFTPVENLNLYFHISYCEFICPFCHYAKTYSPIDGAGELDVGVYVKALFKEIDNRSRLLKQSNVNSIYIGGGTPTVLAPKVLEKLLSKITGTLSNQPKLFCVETSPLTMAEPNSVDKLQVLMDAGVNRISIGVQTFDEKLLSRYRGHKLNDMMHGLEKLLKLDVQLNIDLIQDFPTQSASSLRNDLAMIDQMRPHQVTWYIMRPEKEAPMYKQLIRGDIPGVISDKASIVRRYHIIQQMRAIGYTLRAGGRFVRDEDIHDEYKHIRNGLDSTLLGFGVSSYSHGWGWFFRNTTDRKIRSGIKDYVARISNVSSAIETGLQISGLEKRAALRVLGIRSRLSQDHLSGSDIDSEIARSLVKALAENNLLTIEKNGDAILNDFGRVFEEEISSLFFSSNVISQLRTKNKYWVSKTFPELNDILNSTQDLGKLAI